MRFFLVNSAAGAVRTRVNVRTTVNTSKIRRERRNGRDVIIVPSATLPDGVVMNGVRYPADEIAKSFHTLNRTLAPLGHPNVEGAFVSASDPEGIARGYIGAWNENVRRENGRVFLDKVIDVQMAGQLEGGKALLAALEKGEAIHTSTGLYCMVETAEKDAPDGATQIAREIVFDHDAILIGEDGAATPAQGVGMLVNGARDRDGKPINVINSALEDAERELDWAAEHLFRSVERLDRASMVDQLKAVLVEAVRRMTGRETSTTEKENAMDDAKFKALSDEVKALSESVKTVQNGQAEAITAAVTAAMAPVTAQLTEIVNAHKAKEESELSELREKIVNAGMMAKEDAAELTLKTARALANKLGRPAALGIHNAAPVTGAKPAYAAPEAKD